MHHAHRKLDEEAAVPAYVAAATRARVFALLALQLLATLGAVAAAAAWPAPWLTAPAVGLGAALGLLPLACAAQGLARRAPWNVLLLGAVTACAALLLAHLAAALGARPVLEALGAGALAFGALAAVAARLDAAPPLAPWLGVAALALLAVGALHLALGGAWLHALYAWLGVVVFAAYTLHDVGRLLHDGAPDDAVEVCLHLYLDVVNLALLALDCAGGGAAE